MALETSTLEASQQVIREVYVACEQLNSHDPKKDKPTTRFPGDEMPEVYDWHWTTVESYLRNHRIEKVQKVADPPKRGPGRPRTV